jgi:hypothetical protein
MKTIWCRSHVWVWIGRRVYVINNLHAYGVVRMR